MTNKQGCCPKCHDAFYKAGYPVVNLCKNVRCECHTQPASEGIIDWAGLHTGKYRTSEPASEDHMDAFAHSIYNQSKYGRSTCYDDDCKHCAPPEKQEWEVELYEIFRRAAALNEKGEYPYQVDLENIQSFISHLLSQTRKETLEEVKGVVMEEIDYLIPLGGCGCSDKASCAAKKGVLLELKGRLTATLEALEKKISSTL